MASFRLVLAALMPLVIIPAIQGLTGAWTYSLFGFVAVVGASVPFILFHFGEQMRVKSVYSTESARARRIAMGLNPDLNEEEEMDFWGGERV